MDTRHRPEAVRADKAVLELQRIRIFDVAAVLPGIELVSPAAWTTCMNLVRELEYKHV